MDIIRAFGIDINKKERISFVGGGGKTTTMFALAQALKKKGCRVLVTTTTHIFYPGKDQYDLMVMNPAPSLEMFKDVMPAEVVCLGGGLIRETKKVKSVSSAFLDTLFTSGVFDYILVEADGAKGKPIKAPAEDEPVVPALTTLVVGVVGMDACGRAAKDDTVFRLERFCDVTNISEGEIVTEKTIANLIKHDCGLFKNAPASALKAVLLNKAESLDLRKKCETIAGLVSTEAGIVLTVSASMNQEKIYSRFDPAGI